MIDRKMIEAELAKRRQGLRTLDEGYRKAKIAIESEEGQKAREDTFIQICEAIAGFQAGDSGEKAIFLIASLSPSVKFLANPLRVIREYEQQKKTIENLESALGRG